MSAAFTIFAKKVGRECRIPFEVSADPFYSESNIRYLEQKKREIDEGKAHFADKPSSAPMGVHFPRSNPFYPAALS